MVLLSSLFSRKAGFGVFLVIFYSLGIYWGLPSAFSPAGDSPVPLNPLAFIGDWSNPHVAQKYPAVHFILLLPIYSIALLLFKITGNLGSISTTWPFGFENPSIAFSTLIISSRFVSVLMAVAIILNIKKISFQETNQDRILRIWLSMILLATSGVFTYYSRTGNLDIPYLFWWVLSFVYLWRYVFEDNGNENYLSLIAIFSALSIGTKDQAFGLIIGTFIIIIYVHWHDNYSLSTRFKPAISFLKTLIISYFIIAVLPQPIRWFEHMKYWLIPSNHRIADFIQYEFSIIGYLGLIKGIFKDISVILPPIILLFSFFGILFLIKNKMYKEIIILFIPVLCYLGFFIMPIRFVFERFLMPVAFILILLAGKGMVVFYHYITNRHFGLKLFWMIIIPILIYHFIQGYFFITYLQLNDQKRILANQIHDYVPENSVIMWHGGYTGFPNADVYEKYFFIHPKNKKYYKTFSGVFWNEDYSNYDYILSQNILNDTSLFSLKKTWVYPIWLKKQVFIPVTEYFLYKKGNG